MNLTYRIQKEALARGMSLDTMTRETYDSLAIEIRTNAELVRDGAKRYISQAASALGVSVSLPVLSYRESKCEMCPHLRTLVDGESACDACTCSGQDLRNKRRTPWARCPIGEWEVVDAD